MKNLILRIIFAVLASFLVSGIVFAQSGQTLKINPQKIDAKKLFDAQKISRQITVLPDLGVKGAYLSWLNYDKFGYRLDVMPVLTKNSKSEKIYALDENGKLISIKIAVEALNKDGKVLETCERDLLGWTVEETETTYPVCEFNESVWKSADRFRITADSKSVVKEVNKKNNVIIVKKTEFTGKEYSSEVSPAS